MKEQIKTRDSVEFMLEEYKNIACTHDKLRDNIIVIFNYFLIISAIPFTLLNFNAQISSIYSTINLLGYCFLIVSIGDSLLALSMLNAKYTQYTYAISVNLIRKYFVDNNEDIGAYLFLPKTCKEPKLKYPGFVTYQILFIIILAAFYCIMGLVVFKIPTKYIILISCLYLFAIAAGVYFVYKHFNDGIKQWMHQNSFIKG